ncbi:MAG: rod-binding protein [Sphingobium sp.]
MQISGLSSSVSAAATPEKAALGKAAQQFEAIFLRQMIGAMRSASLSEGVFDSSATEQFRDMADAKTADSMASQGSLGIAEMLLSQFGGGTNAGPIKPDGPAKDSSA